MFETSLSDLAAFVRVLFGASIVFVVLPLYVLPRPAGARSQLDVWAANVARWLAILIPLVHVLGGMRSYSRVSMFASIIVLAWFLRYKKQFGGIGGLFQRMYRRADLPPVRKPAGPSVSQRAQMVLLTLPLAGVFGVSFFLRARDAFGSYALSPPDAYIHMSWANSFIDGQVWTDGVYPQGLSAVVAAVHTFTPFTELLDVARFLGPMVGTSVVVGIYYVVIRLTRSPGAALFSAGLIGVFGAMPEWRVPWERYIGLLPQEFGLTMALFAVVFAVLAVTERGGGRLLKLGSSGGLAMSGNVLSLAAAGLVAAMTHPLSAAWLGVIVAVAAISATAISWRISQLIGAGVATIAGVGAGIAVVPIAQFLGVPPYLGYGAGEAFGDVVGGINPAEQTAYLLRWFGQLSFLEHNWLSRSGMVASVIALVGVGLLLIRRTTRTQAAQLLGLSSVGALAAFGYDLSAFASQVDGFYLVRLSYLLGQTLPVAFGAGLGVLAIIVAQRVSFARIAALTAAGVVALGAFAFQLDPPARVTAIGGSFEREQIEYEEMTRATMQLKLDFRRGTYTVVGPTSQRQVLGGHGLTIEQWVFARDVVGILDDEMLPVPTSETIVFVELDPFPVREISPNSASSEYYFDLDKRGRIQAIIYEWAERRRRVNPDTTIYFEGERIRAYRISRNPSVHIDQNETAFLDYRWRPGELFNDGPVSPREIEAEIEALPGPDFSDDASS